MITTQALSTPRDNGRWRAWLMLATLGLVPMLVLALVSWLLPGYLLIAVIALAVITVVVAWLLSNSEFQLSNESLIAQQRQFAERVAAGDLSARLDVNTFQHSRGFSQMAVDLNRMVEAVH